MAAKRMHKLTTNNKGFTIIELIIATAIFSGAVLLLILGFLSMSRSFTKGLVVTETQNSARSSINTISQAIQFGDPSTFNIGVPAVVSLSSPTAHPSGWFCADNQIFAYTLGQEVVTGSDALMEIPVSSCNTVSLCSGTITANCFSKTPLAVELLAPKMRLAALNVTAGLGNTFLINLKIAYGDDSYISPVVVSGIKYYYDIGTTPVHCIGQAVIDFCATANLQTVVEPRIAN